MCRNGQNECSWIVAMDHAGQIDEAVAAFVRRVNRRTIERAKKDEIKGE